MTDAIVAHFKRWAADKVEWTGRTKNAHLMLKPLPLFQEYLEAHPNAFESVGYVKLASKAAGMKSHVYPIFRDQILPPALRAIRADQLSVQVDEVEETKYILKKQELNNGECMPRAVVAWQRATASRADA